MSGSRQGRYGVREAGRVWRTFGWTGFVRIEKVKVDGFKEDIYKEFRSSIKFERRERKREREEKEAGRFSDRE